MGNTKSNLTFKQRHTFTIENPVMSWSMYSSWNYDKEQWYNTYVLGKNQDSAELRFGKANADSMETAQPLAPFTRLNVKKDGTMDEQEFDTWLGKLHLIGSADTCTAIKKYLPESPFPAGEFKTGVKPWDQKRVDEHGQLTFYSLCFWLQFGIAPIDVHWFFEWARTIKKESGDFHHVISFPDPIEIKHFKTKRTMTQVLRLAADIKKVHKEMILYVKNHV